MAGWFLAAGHPAVADPLSELKAASGLGEVDAGKLRRGDILAARGTQGSFARGVYAESAYFLNAAPDTVERTLLHWDPSKYPEAEVSAYDTYPWPTTTPGVFKTFALEEKKALDRTLLDWTIATGTHGQAGELHLRPDETKEFQQTFAGRNLTGPGAQEAAVNAAWQATLHRHSDLVGAGGFAAQPSYKSGGATISAADEFRSLLKMTPTIAARFAPLTGAKPLADGSGTTADEVVPYAEESQVHGHTSFGLGVMSALRTPGGNGWLAADYTYYTADTYFVSLTVYQFWPWEGGTLVWQVDYASAPFRSYLGGVDRTFAGREMAKDSAGAVATFRKELTKGQR